MTDPIATLGAGIRTARLESEQTPFSPIPTPGGPVRGPVEITVIIEGTVVGATAAELAQEFGEQYARQAGLAGVIVGGFSDG